jgi:hypothetical protein
MQARIGIKPRFMSGPFILFFVINLSIKSFYKTTSDTTRAGFCDVAFLVILSKFQSLPTLLARSQQQ